jgi:flagellar hook-associated protein 1 FlgK
MSASLNVATRALTTNLAALQVVGNNIANVNTEGYSRQNVALKTSGYQERSNGFFGQGVEIATVTRNHDAYLTREANAAKSVASADGMRLSKLKQLEDLFPTGPTGLGASMNSMLNAWNDVASAPSNLTARTVVLARGDEFAARVRTTAAQLDQQQLGTELQVESTVKSVNRLAQDLAAVNQRILDTPRSGNTPNDLFDQRDQLISELNRYVQTSTVPSENGAVSVFISGSQPLVLGATANQLAFPAGTSPRELQFVQGSTTIPINHKQLGGGELTGLMTFLRDDLGGMKVQLDQLAFDLATNVNAQHRLGMGLDGVAGRNFFVPPPGLLDSPPSIEGAAKNLQMALTVPGQLAAASPVIVRADPGNGSGLGIESLSALPLSPPNPNLTQEVTLTIASSGAYEIRDTTPAATLLNSGSYTPGTPIAFNGWSLTLRGSPGDGDTFTVQSSVGSPISQNAGNANAILALRDKAMANGVPLADGYVSVISSLGTQVQSAKFAAEFTAQVATSTEGARSSQAGVNLDEEAARLLQFQQSYQASAKFLQIAQSTFDTLLQTVGR